MILVVTNHPPPGRAARTILALMAQKGGVGKSSLARAIAVAALQADLTVHVADLNDRQQTCYEWAHRRRLLGVTPEVSVDVYPGIAPAILGAGAVDLLIVDAPGESNPSFLEIARAADGIIQPSRARLDDLNPAIRLFHELVRSGIGREKLALALYGLGSAASERDMRAYVARTGYAVLAGAIDHMESYGRAMDLGRSLVETPLGHLNAAARRVCDEVLELVAARSRAPLDADSRFRPRLRVKAGR
jgi:chromosome partitioning protein